MLRIYGTIIITVNSYKYLLDYLHYVWQLTKYQTSIVLSRLWTSNFLSLLICIIISN